MFPHIPRETIHDDLAFTGSIESTCDRILNGTVVAPPVSNFDTNRFIF